MRLVRTEYLVQSGKPNVHVFIREGLKRTIIKDNGLVPYFYIPIKEASNIWKYADEKEYKALDGTLLRKIVCTLPEDVPKLREQFSKSYEADILFPNRYLIDKVDVIEPTTPRVLFIDIETDNKGKVPNTTTATEPIICISVYDNLADIYSTFVWRSDIAPGQNNDVVDDSLHEINFYKNEKDMLCAFTKFVFEIEPDIMTGWFSNAFDIPYIINRMLGTGLNPSELSVLKQTYIRNDGEPIIRGMALIDLIDAYKKFTFNIEESYSLGFIAEKTIGKGKTGSSANVNWLWKHNLDELIAYNVNDVALCVSINKKRQLIEFLDEIRRLCFCQYEDTFASSKTLDTYILKMFHNRIIFPTKRHNPREEFEGAIVQNWATGIKDNVVVFDLKSLYPSIIMTCGLSTECFTNIKTKDCIEINGNIIDLSKKGFLVEVVKGLFEERFKYKNLMKSEVVGSDKYKLYDNRQFALKILLNSVYGQTAYPNSRIFDDRIASTITFLGRKIIMWTRDKLASLGLNVLYVDTDSCFWTGNREMSINEIEDIRSKINKSYDDFVIKELGTPILHNFEIEFDKLYRRAFFGQAKKRYAGHVIYESGQKVDYLQAVGFEIRRSDAAQFSRNLQSVIFDMLLRQDKSKDEVMRFIGIEISRLRTGNFMFSEIGIPKGIQKDLKDYEHPGSNVRGAKYAVNKLGVQLSNKPKLLYVSNMPKGFEETDVLCFDEDAQVPPGTQINIEKMLDKLVKDKIDSIFEALGWDIRELVYHWKGKSEPQGTQESLLGDDVLSELTDKSKVKVKKKIKIIKK